MPEIGVRTRIDKVTRATDGSVDMPPDPDHAGWYTGSATPGEIGNTIVVGHLDSRSGPAAFYGLGALRKGSRIVITRHDGSTAHFSVTAMNVWAKDDFPSRRVYSPTTTPTLTLITCRMGHPTPHLPLQPRTDRKTHHLHLPVELTAD
ncbi:sortase domain-bontaining protein [Streptomyces anulatus]|uniref:sortase domain-containing protein n=1 Tax=Streptomyces anulatus TaxID=1892 RepID=UPI003651EEE0